jgi:hypothetical protein
VCLLANVDPFVFCSPSNSGQALSALLKTSDSSEKVAGAAVSQMRVAGTTMGLMADDIQEAVEAMGDGAAAPGDGKTTQRQKHRSKKGKRGKRGGKSKSKRRRRGDESGSSDKDNGNDSSEAEAPDVARERDLESLALASAAGLRAHAVLAVKLSDARQTLNDSVHAELAGSLPASIKRDVRDASAAEKRFDKQVAALASAERQVHRAMGSKAIDLNRVGDAEGDRDDAKKWLAEATRVEAQAVRVANRNIEAEATARAANLVDAHALFFEAGLEALLELRPEIDRLRRELAMAAAQSHAAELTD